MPRLPIAIQLASLRLPFKQALLAAAQLGADAVEVDARGDIKPQDLSATGLRELRRMLEELNLRVVAVGFQTRHGYDVLEGLDRRMAATKVAMKFAADLRAPVVINQIGRVPSESTGTGWELLVAALSELSNFGSHVGALLAAQTGSESGADLARLLAALPHGIVVDLDPGNLIINGFSAAQAVDSLHERIQHVHARDAVRDLARGRGLEVPLGRGSVDFPALLGALEEYGYRGPLTITRENADDPQFEIGQAVEFLRSL